jgi:hypothetical protein
MKTVKPVKPLMKPNYLVIPAHLAAAYLASGDWTMVQFLDWFAAREEQIANDSYSRGHREGYNKAMGSRPGVYSNIAILPW